MSKTRQPCTGTSPFTQADWNFDHVPEDELFCCCWWEYARESARIRAAYDPDDQNFFPDPKRCEIVSPSGQRLPTGTAFNTARAGFISQLREYALPVFFVCNQARRIGLLQPLNHPWASLPDSVRRGAMGEMTPYLAEQPVLTFLPFNRCSDLRDLGLAEAAYRCAEFDAELGVERLRVEIDWAGFTDPQIVQAFKSWVAENRPPGVGTSGKRGTRKGKGFRDYLAWLGMLRLMHVWPYTSIERESPQGWSCYRSADWPRSRQKALKKFREFFPFLPPEERPLRWRTAGGRAR